MKWLALLFAVSLCSCSDAPKVTTAHVAPPAHSIGADGTPVPEAPEPEVVRLTKVETVDLMMHVTVGNLAGDYLLSCNPDVNKDSGVRSCLTPIPGRDYLLFRNNTKWLVNGAKQPMSLKFMQDWSVTYNNGENIGLLEAKSAERQGFGLYLLLSWTAKSPTS